MRPAVDFLHDPEREQILDQVLDARSLPEIEVARCNLRDWLHRYPEDTGIREAFGGLYLLEDIAREQEAERMMTATSEQVEQVAS